MFWSNAVIGEAALVLTTPKGPPMKMNTRSVATPLMLLAPLQQPGQLSIAFETPAIAGLTAEQRGAALQALAAMLLQAAGSPLAEGDDVQQ